MHRLLLAAFCALALSACVKGAKGNACSTDQQNRCSCADGTEGIQVCLPTHDAFSACTCSGFCAANPASCAPMPDVVGKDMDGAGAAIDGVGLSLPDPVDPTGFITVQQINDPPVQVLAQDPAPGTLVKLGERVKLTVAYPPDQESLGLPNSNFLVGKLQQDDEESSQLYYDVLDPGPFPTRATLADWKAANGFGTPADAEASAIYMTHADLGFGRHMHMRRKGKWVSFYVDNYPTIEDAIAGTRFFATVAMEYSPGPHGLPTDPYFTQFYVYNKKGELITDPILDDHGPKQTPAVCLVCHGGTTDQNYATSGVNLGAHFIPFDLDAEEFSTRPGYTRADQEAAFKAFNEAVQSTWDPLDPAYDPSDPPPVIGLVDGWYGGPGHPSPTFLTGATPPGWDVSLQAHDLYHQVFSKACQTCHSQREQTRNFSTYAKFDGARALIQQRVFEEGAMPLSEKGSLNFWLSYPHQPTILASWLGIQLTGPGKPVARASFTYPGTLLVTGTPVTLDGSDSQYGAAWAWTQVGGPAVTLTPLLPNQSKMTFSVPATCIPMKFQLVVSNLGRSSDPAFVTVAPQCIPAAPSSVTAVAGLNSATVSWTQTSDGNNAIQHSTVIASPGGATAQVTGAGTSLLVPGLTAGTTYTFTVIATNEIGDSATSSPSNAVTVFTTPGAPTGVVASRNGTGGQQVSLTWTPPANTGGVPLTGYSVTGNPAPSTPVSFGPGVGTAVNPAVITGLTNGVSYTFTVFAENGAQSAGAVSNAVTPATFPGAPASATAAPGNGSASVSWTPPASNGGDPVTYTVTTNLISGGGAVPPATSTGGLSATINGLTNNSTYTFTVTAVNSIGAGPGTTTNAVLPSSTPGVPSAPQNVSAAFAGVSQTATVTWNVPVVTGNSAILSYSISGTPSFGTPVVIAASTACPTSSCSANVGGLTGGISYTFTVSATNTQGTGPGATSASTAIFGPPQPPTLNSVIAGYVSGTIGQLQVNWTAPANSGGATIDNYVISTSPAITPVSAGTATTRTLTSADGLAQCTVYTVSVTAHNTWGTSSSSNAIAARDALVPSAPSFTTATTGTASISLAWSTPSNRGCPITQYNFTSNPFGLGSSTTLTSAFINQNSCAYTSNGVTSSATCTRSWSFQVQAVNAVGASAFSAATAFLRPLVSYSSDNVYSIWSLNPNNGSTNFGTCTGCHTTGNILRLDGTQDPNAAACSGVPDCTYKSIIAEGVAANSFILLCPENSASCVPPGFTSHPGGLKFTSGTAEAATIQQWLNDGSRF